MKGEELRKTMKSMKAKLIMLLLAASLAPGLIKAQTSDEGVIKTSNDNTEWTTGQIKTPGVQWIYDGQPLSIFYNSADTSVAQGMWQNYDVSDNLSPFTTDISGNLSFTWNTFDGTIAEQPITINYMLADSVNARHGVGDKIDRKVDRYEITASINYTDTTTGQPMTVNFHMPNHLYKFFTNLDTSAQTPWRSSHSYDLNNNPDSLDMVLDNIYDVMVNPGLAQNKTNMEQMNETSPYSGEGNATNATLEMISDGGLDNPFNPASVSFTMEDHSKKKSGYDKPETSGSPNPPDDGDLETMVFKTANGGNVTVKYVMPDTTVTHPGAEVINIYEIVVDSGYEPKFVVNTNGLPYQLSTTQVNDTTFDAALSVQTPPGQTGTYDVDVEFDAVPVGVPDIPEKEDYDAINIPNPFTDNTTLQYSLKKDDFVKIDVYDMQGRLVQQAFEGNQKAGTHQINLDGSDLSAGIYFGNISTSQGGSYAVRFVKE